LWLVSKGRPDVKRAAVAETLHGCARRRKALKGEPHERIRHEIRPADVGRMKAPRG